MMDARIPLIQCFPYDLLHSVFQEVMANNQAPSSHIAVATVLSHVCRDWRDVALRCPFLWCYITFHMRKIDRVSEIAGNLASRMSMVPVTICVDYTGAYSITGIPRRGALNHCLLYKFPVLHTLEFRFDSKIEKECIEKHYNSQHDGIFNMMSILDDVVHLPKEPLDSLRILHRNTKSKPGLTLSFTGVEEFISKLKPSRSLQLSIPGSIMYDGAPNWFTLRDLSVLAQELEPSMLLAVPNLINLELSHITGYNGFLNSQSILLPNLQVLNLNHGPCYRRNPRVRCPNLQKLAITSFYSGTWGLFTLNSELVHLTTLTLDVDTNVFCDIAPTLPQITVLSVSIYNYRYDILRILSKSWLTDFEELPFPYLQDLSIDIWKISKEDDDENELSLETFNDFVSNRFLPPGHPGRGTHATNVAIRRFVIYESKNTSGEWLNSTYIQLFDLEKLENREERIVTLKPAASKDMQ